MPPARVVSRRAVNDENAENTNAARVTRAKAASLSTDVDVAEPPKKALAAKSGRNTSTTNAALGARKRTALGDLSNVGKKEPNEADGKKSILSKTTKPAGIQKAPARTNSTRTVLGQKATNTTTSELKRPASGAGGVGHLTKKRAVTATTSVRADEEDDDDESENVAPPTNGSGVSLKQEKAVKIKHEMSDELDDDQEMSWEEFTKDAKDLDREDMDDPLMVAEYVHEIFDYMKELEIATQPNPDYMDNQGELEWKMRGILIDWLLEVHTRFRLLPETLFLAVNIIDRFLSCKVVQLDRLQLVGVTAMFIAAKYEEILSPHVQNFVHVADDGFTESEILSAERYLLQSLDYDLSYPNPMNFLRRISKADSYDIQTRTLGKYLLEIGCVDHRFIKYPPSHVAAAAMYLARLVLQRGEWDATLAKYAGYTEWEIKPVFELMVDYLYAPTIHDAFFRKYANKKFLKASIVLKQWARKAGPKYLPHLTEQTTSESTVRELDPSKARRSLDFFLDEA